jgi:molybdopterin synthase sulfur carrier subunit
MKIKIRSYGSFRDILGKEVEIDLMEPSQVEDAIRILRDQHLEFQKDFTDETLIVLNDRVVLRNHGAIESKTLSDGDILSIYPPVSGG